MFIIGGWDGRSYNNDIYQIDPSGGACHYFGSMAHARQCHAVKITNSDRFAKYCH